MISFYGGPNGIQGIQGIQGNKGDAFKIYTVVEGNINSYIFSDSDKANYNSDNGAWLGLYDKSDNQHKFYIMQWQFSEPPVPEGERREREGKQESFLLGILNNPLWYILKDNKLMVSNEHIFLTRDQNGVLSESGQLDFTISDNSLKISTKTDDGDKIYISPKSYDLDKENGYLTVNNIFDAYPIGDVKIRAIPDNGILTGEGKKWIDFTDGATFITKDKTFLNTLNYKNCGLIDPESNDIQLSLETFKEIYKDVVNTYNLEEIYNGLKPLTVYNNQAIYIFELEANKILSILYYSLSGSISKHIEINRTNNSDVFNFWIAQKNKLNSQEEYCWNFTEAPNYYWKFWFSSFEGPQKVKSVVTNKSTYESPIKVDKLYLIKNNIIYVQINANGLPSIFIIDKINNEQPEFKAVHGFPPSLENYNFCQLFDDIFLRIQVYQRDLDGKLIMVLYKLEGTEFKILGDELSFPHTCSVDPDSHQVTPVCYPFIYNGIKYFIICLQPIDDRSTEGIYNFRLFSLTNDKINFLKILKFRECSFSQTEIGLYKKYFSTITYSGNLNNYLLSAYYNNNNISILYTLKDLNGIINNILIFYGHIIKLNKLVEEETPIFEPLPLNFYFKFYQNISQLISNQYYKLSDGNFHSIKNDIYDYLDEINYLVYSLGLDNFYSYLKIK